VSDHEREPVTDTPPATPLPAYRRRRRSLVFVVVLVFTIGVVGLALDVRRMVGDPTEPLVDILGRPTAPTFAFDVTGPEETPLQRPVSIAITDERIYVSDSLAGHIAVFRHSGAYEGSIGGDRLVVPLYVSVSPAGERLFVSDRALEAVLSFSSLDGSFIETITPTVLTRLDTTSQPGPVANGSAEQTASPSTEGTTSASAEETLTPLAWSPIAVEVADDGSLLVSDVAGTHRVWRLERDGAVIRGVPDSEDENPEVTLDFPNAVKSIGERVWVSDSNSRRLLEFGEGGTLARSLPLGRLIRGFDVVLAEEGGPVYFALVDAFSHEVVLLSESGSEVARFGEPGTGPGQFSFPNDVVVHEGVTWVVDTGNARIQAWEWGESARVAAAAVWPGGPSWIGVASALLLLAPLALLFLLRRVRAAVSPETVPILSVQGADGRWGRVRLLVPPSAGEPPVADTLPPIQTSLVSPSDVAFIGQVYSLDTEQAEVLSIALRVRMLVTEDETLAVVARARGVEVYDPESFAGEFASAGVVIVEAEESGEDG
jgi:hypothetical protein